ncbi:MAG: YgjV family protein, partial [Clostridia bacterium]|nr:YgjV family protein [Clostridia bacterium]
MSAATILLIANILSLVGNVIATSAAFLKSKRNILLFQSSNHVLEIIAQTMTEAYSGVTQEVISLVRNVSLVFIKSAKKAPKLIISVVCLVAGLVAGVLFNVYFSNNVLYGYLPVA